MTMIATYRQEGDTIDYTPSADVAAGAVVVQGSLIGIATQAIPANVLGALTIRGGVRIAKSTSEAIAAGKDIYWNPTAAQVTATPGGSAAILIGKSILAAGTTDATVDLVLIPAEGADVRAAYTNTAASAAVTNTVTETAFDKSVSLPANSLKAGDVLRVRAQVIATAQNSTDTLLLALYIGGVQIVATAAVDVATNDIGYIDAEVVIRTIGATGTLVAAGVQALGVPGTVTAKPFLKASTAVDTTAAVAVEVKATWSVANAGNSCRLDVLTVERLAS